MTKPIKPKTKKADSIRAWAVVDSRRKHRNSVDELEIHATKGEAEANAGTLYDERVVPVTVTFD